jgi:3'-phosphoadenosine 5'-phosphosulfate sulfotransferase (PAPS reductase)/FAD synthetase
MKSMIQNFQADQVIVSVSGGKDSAALMQYAIENFPKDKLVCVHAKIDIDWNETLGVVQAQVKHYGLPLVIVEAVDKAGNPKGFLSQLTSPRVDRKTGETKEYQFPSMGQRWCTSMLKVGPIDKYARSLKGNVLVLIGERREESSQRAKLEAWRPDVENSKTGRVVVKCSPILDLTEAQVWAIIEKNNIPTHPCYSWGVSRASCAICIFSSDKEILLAAKHAPEIVAKYIAAESKIKHAFRYKPATKTRPEQKLTVADILKKRAI